MLLQINESKKLNFDNFVLTKRIVLNNFKMSHIFPKYQSDRNYK